MRPACGALPMMAMMIAVTVARAEPGIDPPPGDEIMRRIRELYERKDFEGVRHELLRAYELTPHPSLLFALGQVELNLENYAAAIEYYEKFIATNPAEEQIALAQQAIGAARMRLAQPKPRPENPPPPPPRRREWFVRDTVTVAIGGTLALGGAGLFYWGRRIGNDRSGTLADYDDRTDRARALQWTGTGLAAVGTIAIAVALVRWRLRPDDDVLITPTGVAVSTRW